VPLPDEDPAIFALVARWLYAGRFWTPEDNSGRKMSLEYDTVLKVCFFAVDAGMRELLNGALSLLWVKHVEGGGVDVEVRCIREMYERPWCGPVRRLIVDILAEMWDFESLEETDMLPRDFLCDVLVRLRDQGRVPGGPHLRSFWVWGEEIRRTFCERYHDHDGLGWMDPAVIG
jgi:hypothetical protein